MSTHNIKAGTKGKYFAVRLQPGKGMRVEAGMRRFVNKPSYAFPWHGAKIPIPFQY